jgi:hypothetical protein
MDIIKIIDDRLPNLHNTLKEILITRISLLGPCKKGLIYSEINSFKKEHNIIAVGKFTRKYWLSRGWPENEISSLTILNGRNKENLSSPMSISHWLNRINPDTGKFYSTEEAKIKIKSHRKLNIEYWLKLGYSKEDAKLEVSKYQKENGNKFSAKNKKFPEKYLDRTWTQNNYWLKLGYSPDEAKEIIRSLQDKTSLASFIHRYGEHEGTERRHNYLNKLSYSGTIDYYIDKYGESEGTLKYEKYLSSKLPYSSSKESIKFFIPIYKKLRMLGFSKNEIFWGISGSKEYYIYDTSINSIFFYDLCIPKLKKIIEYHGTSFHPNPNWEKTKFDSWKCLFSNIPASEKLKFDEYKENLAKSSGFDILCIWSDSLPSYESIMEFLIK